MSRDSGGLSDRDLERRLVDLGRHLAYPPTPDVTHALPIHVATTGRKSRTTMRHQADRRALGPITVALVTIIGMLTITSPSVRTAAGEWLGIPGVRSTVVGPGMSAGVLNLGQSVSLAYAQAHVPFRILTPSHLGPPAEVYLSTTAPDAIVLAYHARSRLLRVPGRSSLLIIDALHRSTTPNGVFQCFRGRMALPSAPGWHDLLLTEARTNVTQIKYGKRGRVQSFALRLPVGVYPGYWARSPQVVWQYATSRENFVNHPQAAAHTLLWQRDGLTLSLESALSEHAAVRVAASMH